MPAAPSFFPTPDPESLPPAEKAAERRHGAALLLLCLLGLGGLQLLEPLFFLRDDNAAQNLGFFVHAYRALAEDHQLALLNHHQFLGVPFLAAGQTGVFAFPIYPLCWLSYALVGDGRLVIDLLASLNLLLAAWGMWRLLRSSGIRRELALPLALCWAFSPFGVVVGRNWVHATYLAAYLPWNFHFLLRFLARPGARRGLLLVAVKSLFILAGYLHFVALAFLFEGVFLLLRWWRRRREPLLPREVGRVALTFLLALMVAAPLLLPTWQALQMANFRANALGADEVLTYAMSPADFLPAQLPWTRMSAPFDASTAIYFIGWPLLALLPAAARRRQRNELVLPCLGAGLLALLMATRLYWLLYLLPIFSRLRWPFKVLPVAIFFLLFAAAAGAQALAEDPRRARLARAAPWTTLALQALLLLLPATRTPFSPLRLERPLAALQASPTFRRIGDDWRMMAARAQGEGRSMKPAFNGSYDFATLLDKYYVAGNDPMVSKINYRLALGRQFDGELIVPAGEWPAYRRLLEISSARYLMVDEQSRLLPEVEAGGGARRLAAADGVALFELANPLPIVYRMADNRAVPFRWRTNGVEFELPADFPGGDVLVNVAALDGYRWWREGEPQGKPNSADNRILLPAVEKGAARIVVSYSDQDLYRGLGLALAGLLAGFLWWRREPG